MRTPIINFIFISFGFTGCLGQNFYKVHHPNDFVTTDEDNSHRVVWCTVSGGEQRKCLAFAKAVERDQIRVGYDYFKLDCKRAFNKDECMNLLDEEKVTVTTLDAGQVFIGGRYHSLVPILQEVGLGGSRVHYAVAVIKKDTLKDVYNLRHLRGKKACFAGVGTMAGWVLPIYTLMKEGGMKIIDCNNHVKTTTNFFGPSCAVNCLTDKYNPIGDNSDKLCQLCIGRVPGGKCTDADPYAGFDGAFRCLLEAGEIAFLKHTTVEQLLTSDEFSGLSSNGFELLCKDGSRRPIQNYQDCNWGSVPSDALVTSSASSFELRRKYQKFLQKAAELYSLQSFAPNNTNRYGVNGELDQFGNRRFKRQSFGQNDPNNRFSDYGRYDNNDPNRFGNNDPNRFGGNDPNRFGNTNSDSNRFGGNDPNRFGNNEPRFGNNEQNDRFNQDQFNADLAQLDPYRNQDQPNRNQDPSFNRSASGGPFGNDQFSRDPYLINPGQYGVNIDPYSTNVDYNRDRDTPIFSDPKSNGTFDEEVTTGGRNGSNVTYYETFNLFESSPKYGIKANLLFQDTTRSFAILSETQQTFSGFLAKTLDIIMGVRDCPVDHMTLCVTSDPELEKCIKMRTALKAQLLKPEMRCDKAFSHINCMQKIRSGTADVAIFDASDVYTAGLHFDLVPFISEVYNLEGPEYYVVAVTKEADPSTDLTYLRGKNTCHGAMNSAAGWVYPMAYLLSNGWIRPYGCNSIRAAAEYFTKSCVPGALSTEYNTGVPYDNLCDLCHGASFRYCRRDASEDYYGHTGAFRCLVEGGGDVAFVKHTTIMENTGGIRREWWARDALVDDFELLCPDGTRAEVQDYQKCNLGKIKANAIVTRGGYNYNETQINAYINLFLYSQTFYGRKNVDEFSFSMFSSPPPFSDLVFQDATQQLKVIDPKYRYYSTYLGKDYMRARRIVDCHAGATSLKVSVVGVIVAAFLCIVFHS